MKSANLYQYKNGNASIELLADGTRTISFENTLELDYPLNIDIRVSTKCAFGLNPKTKKAICEFCHESARTDGVECNYEELLKVLAPLPRGIELAIGANELTNNLYNFLGECQKAGWICNLTINQGHLHRDEALLLKAIKHELIKGLGISYRSGMKDIPQSLLNYPNTVVHVICGIDEVSEIKSLANKGIKKILVLGEKDFGFNSSKVNLSSLTHKKWRWTVRELFNLFEVVSFDNLGIEQLLIKRFFKDEEWNKFYQGEYSFYINAVDKTFSPSSRSADKTPWNANLQAFFKSLPQSMGLKT